MEFKEFGSKENRTIILIHGFAISWKMWTVQIDTFSKNYHVIVPVLDGHDGEEKSTFISIEKAANEITEYIKENLGGRVFAICGESLGGTITMEILSQEKHIAQKSIINAGPVARDGKVLVALKVWAREVQRKLTKREGRMIKKTYSKSYFPEYLVQDIFRVFGNMSKETNKNAIFSAFTYSMRDSIKNSDAEIVYWYGSKEAVYIKESIKNVMKMAPNIKREEFKGYEHGKLCVANPKLYIKKADEFFNL